MAKIYSYNSEFGTEFESSYWRVSNVSIDVTNRIATFVFFGYVNQAARQAGAQPIGQKTVSVKGSSFDSLYTLHMRLGYNVGKCAYKAAKDAGIFPSEAQDVF